MDRSGAREYDEVILSGAGAYRVANARRRTVSLPAEHAEFIDSKVASGAYGSTSEVVRAGLRALQERDEAVERWLREEVAPAYDAAMAEPSQGVPLGKAFDEIRARHTRQLKKGR